MHHLAVIHLVSIVREGPIAGGAEVGAVSSMGAHETRQVAGICEGLPTGGAGVGAVAGMGVHVFRQVVGPC